MDLIDTIEAMSQEEFEHTFIDLHEGIKTDPLNNFVRSALFMQTEPTAGQLVLYKLIFGQELDYLTKHEVYDEIQDDENGFGLKLKEMTEVELYEYFTGKVYSFEDAGNPTDISLIVGRRGGKTLSSSILAIYSTLKQNWKLKLGKHNVATILVMSHTKDFSDEIVDVVRSLIQDSPIMARLIDTKKKNTQSTINLKIPFRGPKNNVVYSRVRIRTNAASSRSSRGSACPVILMDEIAFWGSDPNSKETDFQIVKATTPSMLQFGDSAMIIKLSSPGIKHGVLWNTYDKRDKLPRSHLVLKSPSWMFNSNLPASKFREEWDISQLEDFDGFDSEFRANFVDSLSEFISAEFVDLCTVKGVQFVPPVSGERRKSVIYAAAIDAAFKKDRFAFCVIGNDGTKLTQHVLKTWEGKKSDPVRAFQVAKYIRRVCREFDIAEVHADQYSFQPLREIFETHNVTLVENTFTLTYKKRIYFNLKKVIHNRQIDLLDNELQKREIKQLQVEQTTTGSIKIGHPPGGTDDTADATAIAALIAVEKSGLGQVAGESYGRAEIATDINGRAFTAPDAVMLGDYMQADVVDNAYLIGTKWRMDEKTREWIRMDKEEEDDEDPGGGGPSFLF